MYVASAVYADHAGTADTASNALKLGGYDASDYLRKDEVQTVTAAYQEIEWTTPGTYNWVVPEGVNSILVTTVGGGGGYGFQVHNSNNYKELLFPGGAGGEVVVNKLIKTTPGETLQIVVGSAGANVTSAGGGEFNNADIIKYNGRSGGDGGISYIARNGTMISDTKARGGVGGLAKWIWSGYSSAWNNPPCNWYHQFQDRNTSTATSMYRGGYLYYGDGYAGDRTPLTDNQKGLNGYSGTGGRVATTSNYIASEYWNSDNSYKRGAGRYWNAGGGGSWGDGGSEDMSPRQRAGIGGGGIHYSIYAYIQPGHGMVRILAIGITYDE